MASTPDTWWPDGPLVVADLHDLFTYYGGERLYKITAPIGGSKDIIPQLPRHLPAGTVKLPIYETLHDRVVEFAGERMLLPSWIS